ncbi:hypothetical protein GCM10010503_08930 [Streptomyces lucensis JCM 4490]|uniref:Uncharacterized protein n=1 Tax=Streptomyces lucensis JCM 4490 TaxID=1306176 RepID=A0A918IZ35_9ACTN|nr:hypothetical protein GCM10010503_08930 [Streptomyces lucensis JCM 4490]
MSVTIREPGVHVQGPYGVEDRLCAFVPGVTETTPAEATRRAAREPGTVEGGTFPFP